MTVVNGLQGPYTTSTVGAYGRNAFVNASQYIHKLAEQYPGIKNAQQVAAQLQSATLQWTPEDTLGQPAFYQNLYGYADEEIQQKGQNGLIGIQEFLSATFEPLKINAVLRWVVSRLGQDELAKRLAVLARNGKAADTLDLMAKQLFEDDPTTSVTQFVASQNRVKLPVGANLPTTRLDGKVTPEERKTAFTLYQEYPQLVRQTLSHLMDTHQLNSKFAQYKILTRVPR